MAGNNAPRSGVVAGPLVFSAGTRAALGLAVLFIAAGIALPEVIGSVLLMTLLAQAAISAILATSVGTLLRLNGMVTFGHATFYGIAVYIIALSVKGGWMPAEAAIVLALVVPTLLALLLGLGIVHIPGIAFSMLTLAVGQAFFEFAMKAREVTGGEDGLSISFPGTLFGIPTSLFQRPQSMFIICWVLLVLVVLGLVLLTRSRFGRLVEAIRENEERARFIGYRTRLARAVVVGISGGIAALGGVLAALYNAFASPDVLHWSLSGYAVIMVVIGGPRIVWGPAFGAIVFFFFKDFAGNLGEHWPALIGLTMIAVTLLIPRGLGGTLATHLEAWRQRRGAAARGAAGG